MTQDVTSFPHPNDRPFPARNDWAPPQPNGFSYLRSDRQPFPSPRDQHFPPPDRSLPREDAESFTRTDGRTLPGAVSAEKSLHLPAPEGERPGFGVRTPRRAPSLTNSSFPRSSVRSGALFGRRTAMGVEAGSGDRSGSAHRSGWEDRPHSADAPGRAHRSDSADRPSSAQWRRQAVGAARTGPAAGTASTAGTAGTAGTTPGARSTGTGPAAGAARSAPAAGAAPEAGTTRAVGTAGTTRTDRPDTAAGPARTAREAGTVRAAGTAEPGRPAPRPAVAAAGLRAVLDDAKAGAELADRLRQAWETAGRPSMGMIGDQVGYSKGTISKVLSGKMAPAWQLVRKLGGVLGVPTTTVKEVWHPLWSAADRYRRAVSNSGAEGRPGGQACEWCGTWVVNTHLHAMWHMRLESAPVALATPDSLQWANLRDALRRRKE